MELYYYTALESVSHNGSVSHRALAIKYCINNNDSHNESTLMVECWTIDRYLDKPPPLTIQPTLTALLGDGSTVMFSRQILDSAVALL